MQRKVVSSGVYEQRFHDCSYGFRPHRKAVDCVAKVAQQVYRHRHILEADIEKFFDQVSHNKLLKMLTREICDPRIFRLISQMLKSGFQEPGKPWQPSGKGTPQWGPLYCLPRTPFRAPPNLPVPQAEVPERRSSRAVAQTDEGSQDQMEIHKAHRCDAQSSRPQAR